jgi:membrane-associated phospholipid phosphatase
MKSKNPGLLAVVLLAGSAVTQADVVTDWNQAALDAIRLAKTPPPMASRALAIMHAAVYDAVNGIDRRNGTYFVTSRVPSSASKVGAASAAAHRALVALFPLSVSKFDSLHAAALASIANGPQKATGVAWGEYVASEVLAWRAADGWNAAVAPPSNTGPGAWMPTPLAFAPYLLPQWGFVYPFALSSATQFRPNGPAALDSAEWAAEYNETKSLGGLGSITRTVDQTEIALFWADGSGTVTPPGHWNDIARDVVAMRGTTLEQNARLFALLNISMADAAIVAWDAKYHYAFWRPITAIRAGDTDGNAATDKDATWVPLLVTPPFPEYVSGHSTFSGAGAAVLAAFFGTDDIAFSTRSDALPGVTRSFSSFSGAAAEAGMSRIYGGIHFQSANEDGLATGRSIGDWAFRYHMQPKGNRSKN